MHGLGEEGPEVLVVAARFPNPIQPWVLNHIEQVYRHGGSVRVVAEGPGFHTNAEFSEPRLRVRAHYYPVVPWYNVVQGLARYFVPSGHRPRAARAGLRQILASGWRPDSGRALLKALVRAPVVHLANCDLVHAHSLTYAYEHRHAAEICGTPMVLSFHGLTPKGVKMISRVKRDQLFQTLCLALVNTDFARRQLIEIGCPPDKIEKLPQGIRLEEYAYVPRPRPESGPVRLLSVSRLLEDKGLIYALGAMKLLIDEGYDLEYTIVGSGPEAAYLKRRVRSLGLTGRVRFTGRLTGAAVRDQYREANVFILPSLGNDLSEWGETQGMVLQEAQASGVIVTASRVGGIPECVDEGRSAFLFEDRNAGAIGEAVAAVIDRPEKWRQWQDAGRTWVEERFDVEVLGDRMWELYAQILAKGTN